MIEGTLIKLDENIFNKEYLIPDIQVRFFTIIKNKYLLNYFYSKKSNSNILLSKALTDF